ncbi:hypothetical protein OTU49_008291 [Cherax quadricarinatus]|uniref:Uncharacterized protein n=1 Tax=Cherax quadricarinatus TaxID=27406 RepID=A0AAW0WCI1_CHEQU
MHTDILYGGAWGTRIRVVLTVLLVATVIYTVVLNALAGPGFSIALLFLKVCEVKVWKLGGAVPSSLILVLIINLNLNVGWLFAWDNISVTASAIILVLIVITNGTALSLSACSFAKDAASLYTKSKFNFWCGILVINGLLLYSTWTTFASTINQSIFYKYELKLDGNSVCLCALSFLVVGFVVWFVLENTVFTLVANPFLTHYIVLLWAIVGIYMEQKDIVSTEVSALITTTIVVAAVLFLTRIFLLIYRNRENGIYKNTVLLLK